MTLTLTPAGRARFLSWLQDIGRSTLRPDAVESEMLQIMEDRTEFGESLSYELGGQYTTSGRPELFYAAAADFDQDQDDDSADDDVTHMVRERLGDVATKQDAELVIAFALAIWQEQINSGLGNANEWATRAHVMNWLENRTYEWTRLYEAASGDVAAIAEVRAEAGVPVIGVLETVFDDAAAERDAGLEAAFADAIGHDKYQRLLDESWQPFAGTAHLSMSLEDAVAREVKAATEFLKDLG